MSTLRYALEALCEYAESSTKDTRPRDKHGPIGRKPVPRLAVDEIRKLLALHADAPEVDRGAVQQAIADELDAEGVVVYGLTPKLTDVVMQALSR